MVQRRKGAAINRNLLFKRDKHIAEVDYGFPVLEHGSNTYIAMTIFVSQHAFFVNNGLDKLNRHVAYGKTERSNDFHFSFPCTSISTTRDGVCCGNFIYNFTMRVAVCSIEIAGIITCVAGIEEESETFAACCCFYMGVVQHVSPVCRQWRSFNGEQLYTVIHANLCFTDGCNNVTA